MPGFGESRVGPSLLHPAHMVLIVLMVMLMDSLTGWLQRKLIKDR